MAAAPTASHAAVKYWDNPDYRAFDIDCYVSGAFWNYDGIRSARASDDPRVHRVPLRHRLRRRRARGASATRGKAEDGQGARAGRSVEESEEPKRDFGTPSGFDAVRGDETARLVRNLAEALGRASDLDEDFAVDEEVAC